MRIDLWPSLELIVLVFPELFDIVIPLMSFEISRFNTERAFPKECPADKGREAAAPVLLFLSLPLAHIISVRMATELDVREPQRRNVLRNSSRKRWLRKQYLHSKISVISVFLDLF